MKKSIIFCLISCMLIGIFSGCSDATVVREETANKTTNTAGEAVTLTMFGYWSEMEGAEPLTSFKAALSERFPEITLEYEAFPTGKMPYTDELTRRLNHDEEFDIIMTTDTALWDSGKLMDLTKQAFSGRYSIATMKRLSENGAVYFLPSVGSVICYAYNADQLKTLEVEPPQTLDELETMMDEVSLKGEHPFIVPYEQTKPLLVKVLASGYLATPQGQLWLDDYNQGSASMKGNAHWDQVWQGVKRMADKGYLTAEDALFAETRRISMLTQGLGVMTTVSSALIGNLNAAKPKQQEDEFALLPLLGDSPENQTVFSEPNGYFAAGVHLDQKANKNKRDAVLKIFDYISTEAGQQMISAGSPLANSYLNNVSLPLSAQAQPIAKVLNEGSYNELPVFERGVEAVVGDAIGKIIEGKMTAEEAMEACDKQNVEYKEEEASADAVKSAVLGTASEKFHWTFRSSRTQELAITNFAVDSMRAALGTEIALELGTAIRGEFFKGDITDEDISSVVRVDKKLYRTQVTGQQIWDLIEQGILLDNSSWFIVVSGLKYSYQPIQGETSGKLLSLTLEDGSPIDLTKTYEVAVSENQMLEVPEVYTFFTYLSEDSGVMLRAAIKKQIIEQGTISPLLDGRIKCE